MKRNAGINKLIGIVLMACAITFVSCENEDEVNSETIEKEIVDTAIDDDKDQDEDTNVAEDAEDGSSENQDQDSDEKEDEQGDASENTDATPSEEEGQPTTDQDNSEMPTEDMTPVEENETVTEQEFVFLLPT
ncbi:hypothetical protein [Aquimarina agarivorans]|uniref:hypothetical protein n=1 Tax=Aquimarina agarivorans TaxID=980584 RepID=UPI000248EFC7|nr:hypothetical protein [Aquimarina agarivorans]